MTSSAVCVNALIGGKENSEAKKPSPLGVCVKFLYLRALAGVRLGSGTALGALPRRVFFGDTRRPMQLRTARGGSFFARRWQHSELNSLGQKQQRQTANWRGLRLPSACVSCPCSSLRHLRVTFASRLPARALLGEGGFEGLTWLCTFWRRPPMAAATSEAVEDLGPSRSVGQSSQHMRLPQGMPTPKPLQPKAVSYGSALRLGLAGLAAHPSHETACLASCNTSDAKAACIIARKSHATFCPTCRRLVRFMQESLHAVSSSRALAAFGICSRVLCGRCSFRQHRPVVVRARAPGSPLPLCPMWRQEGSRSGSFTSSPLLAVVGVVVSIRGLRQESTSFSLEV